ncbi:MAG: xanthine dehydrogenase family protein molybdopterin-binding subunit [bacterium]|nr:xanthine dehydrogenase family protein molybdopterin-binding subunit [bacterium]MDE0352770.1 xanthine dehydrogenase family protein molybdopterin-binding subunit [bacterium]
MTPQQRPAPVGGIGSSIRRHEDPPLLAGRARYVADVRLPGMLTMVVVRAPVAHGTIRSIDCLEARRLPGVEAVFTAEEVNESLGGIPSIPPRVSFDDTVIPYLQPIIAHDRVRFVGEPMAVVVAGDRYVAEDAADLVFADIDTCPPMLDAGAEDRPGRRLFEPENLVTTLEARFGDAGRAFAEAEVVVEAELATGRHSGVPMETRGIVVEFDPSGERLTVHGATKVPHWNLATTTALLGMPPGRLRMRETAVGGGFGVRGELYPEDVLAVWAADRLGRSVAWIEDRREHLLTANHSREQFHRARIAGDREGRISAIASDFDMDMGAYARTHSIRVADLTLSMIPGPYDLEAYRGTARCVVTNKTPTGTYRAPGRFESSFVRERLIDLYAAEIGMDPVEVRRRNLIKPDRIPYSRPLSSTGEPMLFSDGDFPSILDRLVGSFDWKGLEQRREAGEQVGVGVAMFMEKSGLGPWETGAVEVDPDGLVRVRSGCSSVGQGIRTVLAQIVADRLQLDHARVRVELLDTDRTPYGIGSYASRSTVTAGSALVQAADEVVRITKQVAAVDFEVDASDLDYRNGSVFVSGSPEFSLSIFEAAARLHPVTARKYGRSEPGLAVDSVFEAERVVYPCGANLAVVRVDGETGEVAVEQLILYYDIGRAINPMLVAGQMEGGAIQAVGGTLYEQFAYDGDGNPLCGSFMDYLLPTLAETPTMTALIGEQDPTATNPLGIKGAGEGGVPGVAAAIATAIEHALGRPGLASRLPLTPERVLAPQPSDHGQSGHR